MENTFSMAKCDINSDFVRWIAIYKTSARYLKVGWRSRNVLAKPIADAVARTVCIANSSGVACT